MLSYTGGLNNSSYSSDFLKFTYYNESYIFEEMKKMPSLPIPLAYHCAVALEQDDLLFIHGGTTKNNMINVHSYIYNFTNFKWLTVSYTIQWKTVV